MYTIISGLAALVVKGSNDYYDRRSEDNKLADQKQPDAVVSAPETGGLREWWGLW